MYIFLRNSYLRNLRSNDLVRNRCNHRCQNSMLFTKKSPYKSTSISNRFRFGSPIVDRQCAAVHLLVPAQHTDNSLLVNYNASNDIIIRHISLSHYRADKEPLKPSSKVEVTVQAIKDEQKNKETQAKEAGTKAVVKKKPLQTRIMDELKHYYHGFRLLFIDIRVSAGLVTRILQGKTLTRREHNLLIRTVGDLFRLVPFSVFVLVPFLEFTLPFFIKFFPGMLPSTFQTATEREDKLKQNLKMKLEMAKFLQQTLDDMAVQSKDRTSNSAKEFADWFHKVRTSGEQVSNADIMKFSKLFQDEITLDSISRGQLVALCRVLEVQTLGPTNLLRFQLRMKLRNLAADDKIIEKEGVDSLSVTELQNACKARGMRAYGLSEETLRKQLSQWLDLSLNQKVPPSLLLLSRALMLPDTIPTSDKLKATISVLPDTILAQTSAAIAECEGKIDNKLKMECLQEEVRKIKEERMEQREEQKKREEKEILADQAEVCDASATPEIADAATTQKKQEQISCTDLEMLEDALDTVAKNRLILEKECIEELKEEMAEYQEDLAELKEVTCGDKKPVKQSIAAKRLFNRVNKMISKMDTVVTELESKEKKMKKYLAAGGESVTEEDIVRIDELVNAIKKMKNVPNESVLKQIQNILGKIDDDHDGSIKVEDVLKVIEVIGKENVQLSAKQVDDIIDLIDKEEILEVEDKIEKALQKDADKKAVIKKLPAEMCPKVEPSNCKCPTESKQKMDAQSPTTIPPPISIDQTKKGSNSKML